MAISSNPSHPSDDAIPIRHNKELEVKSQRCWAKEVAICVEHGELSVICQWKILFSDYFFLPLSSKSYGTFNKKSDKKEWPDHHLHKTYLSLDSQMYGVCQAPQAASLSAYRAGKKNILNYRKQERRCHRRNFGTE